MATVTRIGLEWRAAAILASAFSQIGFCIRPDATTPRDDAVLAENASLLLERPVTAYERRLRLLDAKFADTVDTVGCMTQRIALAREVRDRLHAETMRWDDLLALWNGGVSARAQRARIDETYRFAARHFPIASDWNGV